MLGVTAAFLFSKFDVFSVGFLIISKGDLLLYSGATLTATQDGFDVKPVVFSPCFVFYDFWTYGVELAALLVFKLMLADFRRLPPATRFYYFFLLRYLTADDSAVG